MTAKYLQSWAAPMEAEDLAVGFPAEFEATDRLTGSEFSLGSQGETDFGVPKGELIA
jgi:hypothetical protein